MPSIPPAVIDRLQDTVDIIQDPQNPFGRELMCMYWFHAYACEMIAELGGEEIGYNFRQKGQQTLLVYKARFADTQLVVFTTALTPLLCMRSFCRRLCSNTLEWKPDKYA